MTLKKISPILGEPLCGSPNAELSLWLSSAFSTIFAFLFPMIDINTNKGKGRVGKEASCYSLFNGGFV